MITRRPLRHWNRVASHTNRCRFNEPYCSTTSSTVLTTEGEFLNDTASNCVRLICRWQANKPVVGHIYLGMGWKLIKVVSWPSGARRICHWIWDAMKFLDKELKWKKAYQLDGAKKWSERIIDNRTEAPADNVHLNSSLSYSKARPPEVGLKGLSTMTVQTQNYLGNEE